MKKILAVIMISMFLCVGCAHKQKPVELVQPQPLSEEEILKAKVQKVCADLERHQKKYKNMKPQKPELTEEEAAKERAEKAKKVFWYITEAGAIAIIGNSLGLDGAIESAILSK